MARDEVLIHIMLTIEYELCVTYKNNEIKNKKKKKDKEYR